MSSETQKAEIGSAYPQQGNSANSEEVDLKKYLYTLWVGRWIILGSVIAGAIIALLIAFFLTPSYTADGTMMIKQAQQSSSVMNMLGTGNNAISGLINHSFGIGGGVNIANEQEVLESRRLFDAMASKLMKDPIMKNGRMYPVLWKEWPDDSVMTERRYIAARIKSNITYELQSGTTIIGISYDSPSPLEATYMVNLAMQTYQEISKQQNIELAGSATEFLDSQEVEMQDSLQRAEKHLEQFMDTHSIVALDDQTSNLINQIADLQGQKYEAEVKLKGTNASIDEYEKRLNELKPGLSKKLAEAIGPNIEKLQFKISELKTEKALIYSRRPTLKKSDNPPEKVRNINSQVAQLQEQLEQVTDSLVSSNEGFIGFLGQGESGSVISTLTNYSDKLIELRVEKLQYRAQIKYLTEQLQGEQKFREDLPENAMDLARLKRNVKVQEELYLAVTKQRAQMNMSTQAELGNSRPLDRALLPEKPSYPNYLLFLFIGMFTAGFISLGYVTMNSVLSETIRSADDIRKMDIPLLSVIPVIQKFNSANASEHFLSETNQPFSRLANRVLHPSATNTLQTLTVTSSFEGEGKTTVAAGLGMALAHKGKKVIIIGTTTSGGGIGSVFGDESKKGLAELLDQKLPVDDVISETNMETLHYIHSGSSSLINLDGAAFKSCITELRGQYDYIIFDAPAMTTSTYASDLSGLSDGALIIAAFGKTKTSDVQFTKDQLQGVNEPILGVVLNKYKAGRAPERTIVHSGSR